MESKDDEVIYTNGGAIIIDLTPKELNEVIQHTTYTKEQMGYEK